MRAGCKEHIRTENRVFDEQKSIEQEAQNEEITMKMVIMHRFA